NPLALRAARRSWRAHGEPVRGARPPRAADHGCPLPPRPRDGRGGARRPVRPAQLFRRARHAPSPREEGARPARLGRTAARLPADQEPRTDEEDGRAASPAHLLQQFDGIRCRSHAGRRGARPLAGGTQAAGAARGTGAPEWRSAMSTMIAVLVGITVLFLAAMLAQRLLARRSAAT